MAILLEESPEGWKIQLTEAESATFATEVAVSGETMVIRHLRTLLNTYAKRHMETDRRAVYQQLIELPPTEQEKVRDDLEKKPKGEDAEK